MDDQKAWELAEQVYNKAYNIDSKNHRAEKEQEIHDWLMDGDDEDVTIDELVLEWLEYDDGF